MSAIFGVEHPTLPQLTLPGPSRWARNLHAEAWAARWRARELAEAVFGGVARARLVGLREEGAYRALLQLDVPFDDLSTHQLLERRFVAAVERDPILSRIPLVYVIGPA